MPFVPTTRLVLLALAPLLLGAVTALDPGFVWPMLLLDLGVAMFAAVDAWLGRRAILRVEREPPRIFSVGRPNLVRLHLYSRCRRPLAVQVNDDADATLTLEGLPKTVQVPAAPAAAGSGNRGGA